jgi:hypothetical protein
MTAKCDICGDLACNDDGKDSSLKFCPFCYCYMRIFKKPEAKKE